MQGAPFFSFPSLIRSCAVVLSLFAGTAWAEIGTVQFALGDVRIIGPNGVSRAGVKGALINEGDSVATENGGWRAAGHPSGHPDEVR